ncbi:MAG: hypothetical protein LAO51_16300 [Acidobacteriia bacterium]|nr:hypothetical protein [Terriglobia bacterium]
MRPTFRLPIAVVLATLVLAVASGGCVERSTGPAPARVAELSPKLNPFVYFEDGAAVFIGVDGRAAQYIKSESIFPLGLCLANRTKRSLSFSRESFVLEDASRRQVSPVSYEEFASGYARAETDVRLSDTFLEMMQVRFGSFRFASWPLYPAKGVIATARDRVELGADQYTAFYLYFPLPVGGIHGKSFTLLVRAKEAPETFVVKFGLR